MNSQPPIVSYNPDILTCLANLSNDEVFTPPHIANQMLDTLPPELWQNPDAKFLDPFSKSGVFLREIAKRLLVGLESKIPDLQERINHIMKHQLYGIGITELTALLTRRSLYCSKIANDDKYAVPTIFDTPEGNIYYEPTAHSWGRDGRCTYCGASQKEFGEDQRTGLEKHAYAFIHNKNPYQNMNFDVIIGNPPYQLDDGGAQASAAPIYHHFIKQAIKLKPHYLCMIVPSRWFAGGKGLDEFREEMINDKRMKEIHDYPNASDCFSGVEIKGGVNYFLWDKSYQGDCRVVSYEKGEAISEMKRPLKEANSDVFIRQNEAIAILKKVRTLEEESFSMVVNSRNPFGLTTSFKGKTEPYKNEESLKLYQTKGIGYVKPQEILKNHQWIDAHKVIVPKAIGSGDTKTDYVKPIYAEPQTACTETYIVIGPFRDKQRCENVMSYINTQFFHFMLGIKKITQDTTKQVYQFVPLQDFSKPWTDEELYAKYGLDEDEIQYIETTVRPME